MYIHFTYDHGLCFVQIWLDDDIKNPPLYGGNDYQEYNQRQTERMI